MPELDWRRPYIVYGDENGVCVIEQDGNLFTIRGVFIKKVNNEKNGEEKTNKIDKNVQNYTCEVCGKEFSNFNLLNMHKKRFHKLVKE